MPLCVWQYITRVSGADMNEGEENRTDIPEKVGRQGYGAGSN